MSIRPGPADQATPRTVALRSDALGMRPGVRPPAPVPTASKPLCESTGSVQRQLSMPHMGEETGLWGKKKKDGLEAAPKESKSLLQRASDIKDAAKSKLDSAKQSMKDTYDSSNLKHCPGYHKRFKHEYKTLSKGSAVLVCVDPSQTKMAPEADLWSTGLKGDSRILKYKDESVKQAKAIKYEVQGRAIDGHLPRCMGMMMREGPLSEADAKIIKDFVGEMKNDMPGISNGKDGMLYPAHAMVVMSTPTDPIDEILDGTSSLRKDPSPADVQDMFHGIAMPVNIDGEAVYMGHAFYFKRDGAQNNLATMVKVGPKLKEAFQEASTGEHLNLRLAWHARKVNRMLVCAGKYAKEDERNSIKQVYKGQLEDLEL